MNRNFTFKAIERGQGSIDTVAELIKSDFVFTDDDD